MLISNTILKNNKRKQIDVERRKRQRTLERERIGKMRIEINSSIEMM